METLQGLFAGATVDGRYRLMAPLGEGTFGSVWRAEDLRLARRVVAVKFLKGEFLSHAEAVARFEAEADALAQVQHSNVVGVYDRGAWAGTRFLVTEFVAGGTLAAWIDAHRAHRALPSLAAVATRLDMLCAGVGAAHAVRAPGPIVHRDLKPENVLVRDDPSGEVALKVVDFGIAQLGGRGGTRTGAMMGTPLYMAPEQALGNTAAIGPATDVFALAVIAVELLTLDAMAAGEPWWGAALQRAGETAARLYGARRDVPPAVWAVLAHALGPRPGDRPADANALRLALRDAFNAAAQPSLAPPRMAHGTMPMAGLAASHTVPMAGFAAPTTTAPFAHAAPPPARAASSTRVAAIAAMALVGVAFSVRLAMAPRDTGDAPGEPTPSPITALVPQAPTLPPPPPTPAPLPPTPVTAPPPAPDEPPPVDFTAYIAPDASPLRSDVELHGFVARWAAAVGDAVSIGPLDAYYLPGTQFRRLAGRVGATPIRNYYAEALRQGATFHIDLARSEWVLEAESSPDAAPACVGLAGAEGDIVKVRAWAREYSPLRVANSSGEVPCPWIVGRYLLRLRRVDGAYRICHETWSLREGVCASCPAARACGAVPR